MELLRKLPCSCFVVYNIVEAGVRHASLLLLHHYLSKPGLGLWAAVHALAPVVMCLYVWVCSVWILLSLWGLARKTACPLQATRCLETYLNARRSFRQPFPPNAICILQVAFINVSRGIFLGSDTCVVFKMYGKVRLKFTCEARLLLYSVCVSPCLKNPSDDARIWCVNSPEFYETVHRFHQTTMEMFFLIIV